MIYLLDTNACIKYLNDAHSKVRLRINSCSPGDVGICDIVKSELYYGAFKSKNQSASLSKLASFFSAFISLPFDGTAATECGRLRAHLAAIGQPIGPLDFQIASIALANNLILVTHNIREFGRVAGLAIDDWES